MQTSTSRSDLRRVLILDTETSSLDPATGHLLEVAIAGYDLQHGLLNAHSWLCRAPTNEAERVNGIPVELVQNWGIPSREKAQDTIGGCAANFDAVVAHSADFDRSWIGDLGKPWICTCDDVTWPKPSTSKSLVAIALAHGVGVSSAHRALADVMTLVALFDRVRESHDLGAMLARGLRPKARFVSLAPFDRKDEVKAAGFRWEPTQKVWTRTMAIEDAPTLPFEVRQES